MIDNIHQQNLGNTFRNKKASNLRKHKTDVSYQGGSGGMSLDMRYRIPPNLIKDLFS